VTLAIVNLSINVVCGRLIFEHFEQFSQLTTMLGVVAKLGSISPSQPVAEIQELEDLEDLAASLNRRIAWLCIDESRLNDLASIPVLFLNMFGLWKLIAFLLSLDAMRTNRGRIRRMYEAIGSLDAHIAVASYSESMTRVTFPSFDLEAGIDVDRIYHPLIEHPVCNSVVLGRESALITGSNLAGKTTFIKTLGVNLILARTLFLCLAEKARFPLQIVKTSIRQEEKVVDGQSYYSRELEEIRGFLECAPGRFMFLIDEIFRGTNTVERIAIAASTIRYLAGRNMVLVTTHDVELQDLLEGKTRMFHFSEQIDGDRYFFDYVLRPGPCRSGNAIRLLELRGYPSVIVKEAYGLASA
jgi:DNA mismatch repair ATPase MutS